MQNDLYDDMADLRIENQKLREENSRLRFVIKGLQESIERQDNIDDFPGSNDIQKF